MASLKVTNFAKLLTTTAARKVGAVRVMSGEYGSGSGKGGGSGGTIRDAGGSMGKREAAQEEQYFRQKQAEQLAALHEHIEEEIRQHEEQIKQHQESIKKSKEKLANLKKSN
ncbi:ATPase inhibitor [Tropilaelaps mercedesae]|uniref:ATP synthase F1 subunit epsilon n=1 Tax=Tropilaelaps mercedesae TaxID=418985 RepID=A0A1V9XBM4_9ACAR|nr:ATPase inhibitor [Tropilaelaps mercedesae]